MECMGYDIDAENGTISREGMMLDLVGMYPIHALYERICTAQYLAENERPADYEEAFYKACEVRELMLERDLTEEEAIEQIESEEKRRKSNV